jgi:hypothetical protein
MSDQKVMTRGSLAAIKASEGTAEHGLSKALEPQHGDGDRSHHR